MKAFPASISTPAVASGNTTFEIALAGLTVQVKVSLLVAPLSSLAVTVMVNAVLAKTLAETVPEILPLAEMLRPVGRPEAVKVSGSVLGSLNTPDTSNAGMVSPVVVAWFGVGLPTEGAWLRVSSVKVCCAVPPWPSDTATVIVYVPSSVAPAPEVAGASLEAS